MAALPHDEEKEEADKLGLVKVVESLGGELTKIVGDTRQTVEEILKKKTFLMITLASGNHVEELKSVLKECGLETRVATGLSELLLDTYGGMYQNVYQNV